MKKIFSIFLLVAFVFNIVGYKAVFYFAQQKAENQIQKKLNSVNFNSKELFTVKIPLNLPYQTNGKHFERIDGEFNYKGTSYKYVKLKVYHDTLVLVCLNFHEKNRIQTSSDDYFKKVNDLTTGTNKKPVVKQVKLDDYYAPVRTKISELYSSKIYQTLPTDQFRCRLGYLNAFFIPPDGEV